MNSIDDDLNALYLRIGKNIKALRKGQHISQAELGEEIGGVSQSQMSQFENAKQFPSMQVLLKICNFFNTHLECLMFESIVEDERRFYHDRDNYGDLILKCSQRTYYGYYIKESKSANGEKNGKSIGTFELEVGKEINEREAQVKLHVPSKQRCKKSIAGIMKMDSSYARVICWDNNSDNFYMLTFYYYRKESSSWYRGGACLLETLDCHFLPVCQLCILSCNAIGTDKFWGLYSLLSVDMKGTNVLSSNIFSSNGVFRLTKRIDYQVYLWLINNVNLPN